MLRGLMTSRPFAEGGRVLVVRIEQHDVRGRILLQDGAQDERRRAGLAGAGGAEDGEVLAEQIVDADHRRDRWILPDAADAHRVALARRRRPARSSGLLAMRTRSPSVG